MNTDSDQLFHSSGWIDPSTLKFVDDLRLHLPIINKEMSLMLQKHYFDAHCLGFGPRNWLAQEFDIREMSSCVENWIREGGFHSDQIGYDSRKYGEWRTLPLFKSDIPETQLLMQRYLPQTLNLLARIPNLWFSAFFNQPAGAEIAEHRHVPNRRIFHLLMNPLQDGHAWIQVSGEKRTIENSGDCLAFDVRYPHSSGNASSSDRVNLVLEILAS